MSTEQLYAMQEIMATSSPASGISSLIGLAAYVFAALALYTIAQRREIKHAWMAWVPLLNVWTLGSISDHYRLVAKGQKKSKRKVLLAVNIINFILGSGIFVVAIAAIIRVVFGSDAGMSEDELFRTVMTGLGLAAPMIILGFVSFVVQAMALYDVYTSCEPANNVLYLVLSLIPGISQIARPLFLFLCREKDNGMPPKQEPVVVNPVEF